MKKNKSNRWLWILIPLVIILIIVIFVFTFGQVNISDKIDEEEYSDSSNNKSKEEEETHLTALQRRHKKLQYLISQKEELFKKLTKRFKWGYRAVRFILVVLYLGYNALLYFVLEIKNLGDLLNYNEAALIIIALFSFLTFGTFANVKEFVNDIKMKLEVSIYSNYINIKEDILKHKKEEKVIANSVNEQKTKIEHLKQKGNTLT